MYFTLSSGCPFTPFTFTIQPIHRRHSLAHCAFLYIAEEISKLLSLYQRIETARELRHGDLEQIIEHLENLENKDTLSGPNYANYARPAGRQYMKRINHDQIQQVLATLERKGTCWGCMEKGHFFLDKDEKGEYVCKVARQRAANGDLPSPGTPGKT